MSLILGIETSTKICSVAISRGNELLALEEAGGEYSHAEKLTDFIQKVLNRTNLVLKDMDAVAVSKGPGSYTGLRIGVSVAKGLCYSLDKPLIAVDTLQAMAKNVAAQTGDENTLFCPMIDARRMEVYTALYDINNKIIASITAKIIDEHAFATALSQHKIVFFGDGATKCKEVLAVHPNALFFDEGLPSAQFINTIGLVHYQAKRWEDVAYFEPYYLKDFLATTPKKLL